MLKGSSQHLPAATAAAAEVVRPSRHRVLKALQGLPLQALHLAYKAGPSATYDVPAWASGRPSRVVCGSHQQHHQMVVDHSVRLRRPQASMVLI